ncbi:MAG: PAS domain-containing sensor histidine kinase, partial [Hydrogenophaga sp.]|uniref:PAS domain-containing sensor histidine kinase n=1 Tax=Hydrogenophaga sp. TaxID=1904254 RepID=UPI003D9B0926
MSALPTLTPGRPQPDADERQAQVQALEREIEALRAENAHLRRQHAQHLVGTTDGHEITLPAPLDLSLRATGKGVEPLAKLEYEGLLAALASVFPIGVFRVDPTGLLTHVDEALQRIFGLQPEAFTNLGWLRLVHPQDLERVQQHWAQSIARSDSLSVEFRLIRSNGETAHLQVRNVPQLDEKGALIGHIGFVQDISSLRVLQADALIQEELNRQIIASSPDCTKVLDLEGHVLQMTTRGCHLVEVDDFEQVRGSDWTQWWKDENETQARQAVASARRGETARFVAFGETFKATPKWWDTVVSPIHDNRGEPVMLLAVSRDITEQHRQQEHIHRLNNELEARVQERTEALAETNERLRQTLSDAQALYNKAPCGYHSVDASGIFVLINQTELDWLGCTRDEVVGRQHFRDFVQPEHVPQVVERLRRLVAGEKLDAAELNMRRRDGSGFVALLSSTAVTDERGAFVRTNNTLVDITERKAAEHALDAQRTFLQTITNSVPVQLAFFDSALICHFANASYARWVGGDPAALVGRHLSEIARPQDYAFAQPKLAAALRGESQQFEGERVFPDGHRFYASIEYTPYRHDGQVHGVFIQMLDITERKASEDRVQDANRQLGEALQQAQALYNQAPCGYHSLDVNGVFVAINDTELQWLGYDRQDVVGQLNFRDITLPSRVPLLEERMARLLRDGVLGGAEYEMRRKDGSVFHALLSSAAVRDANGHFLHSNTTVVDITARKSAEIALRENQRFLQTITDHVPGMIAYLDAMLRFRFANAEHLRIYGLDPAKMLGIHISEVVPAEVWADIGPRMQAALGGQAQHFEAWRKTVSGESIFINANYLPDIHEGLVQGVFVQIVDITERKRVEERVNQLNDELEQRIQERSLELLESEQRFRLMVDNLREYCIFFLDSQGLITDWTDSAQRMEGYSPTEMLGRHYSLLFERDQPRKAMENADQMMRLAASRGQHELQSWHRRKDGSEYWSHSLLIALRDDHGELKGFAKINRDMTDAKRLDDLMRNINDELENRVADRTEQLLAANKDLESCSYSVSHDLRSPLRHISSFVSLLEEHLTGQLDDTAQKYLSTIGGSARHMSQLIDGLLAFSRLGRSAVNLTAVDFTLLVDAVVSQLAHDTQGRVVDWVIAPDLPVVQGDALLLREVWANLLGNAFKYTRPRERARIEVGWSVDPAVGYTFYVRDNGVGFDTKYASKLFGVFQRLHRATEFEGTGIGLALTRRILERHGGSIWAESQ